MNPSRRFLVILCALTLWASSAAWRHAAADEMGFAATLGVPQPYIPSDNPQTAKKVHLGEKLFNDPALSADRQTSCASCHPRNLAFADGNARSRAVHDQLTRRNTPTVLNAALFHRFNWDGMEASLETQAMRALLNADEMGMSPEGMLARIEASSSYVSLFEDAFGATTFDNAVKAIAAYERSLVTGDSPFDRYLFCSDASAISEAAKRGYESFLHHCLVCHQIQHGSIHPFGGSIALFTDNKFHNLGVGMDLPAPDLGRFEVTGNAEDIGTFKTPTLRNVALTSPYMHDGSLKTLTEVVDFYVKGGIPNRNLDPGIRPLQMNDEAKRDLVQFLETINSRDVQTETRPTEQLSSNCKGR